MLDASQIAPEQLAALGESETLGGLRAELALARLFADPPPPDVMVFD